jgi:hypothetical protein
MEGERMKSDMFVQEGNLGRWRDFGTEGTEKPAYPGEELDIANLTNSRRKTGNTRQHLRSDIGS